jgi:hypothetical protein
MYIYDKMKGGCGDSGVCTITGGGGKRRHRTRKQHVKKTMKRCKTNNRKQSRKMKRRSRGGGCGCNKTPAFLTGGDGGTAGGANLQPYPLNLHSAGGVDGPSGTTSGRLYGGEQLARIEKMMGGIRRGGNGNGKIMGGGNRMSGGGWGLPDFIAVPTSNPILNFGTSTSSSLLANVATATPVVNPSPAIQPVAGFGQHNRPMV